jgi:DNA-binding response OmpR family regulator
MMITIALIEDDVEDQQLICASLKRTERDIKVESFSEAGTFVRYLERTIQLPDMVILDIGLPGINGWELLSVIKTNLSWQNIPVIILSSSIDEKMMEKYFSLDADAYYVKPFRISEYGKIFEKCLDFLESTSK